MRWILSFVVVAVLVGSANLAVAAPARVVTEIDPLAEAMLDARAARRLIALELAEVDVPPVAGTGKASLYFRVVGLAGEQVRVELWERGEAFDVRVVSAEGGAHLLVRRVALAAAELARRLRQRRLVAQREAERKLEQTRILAQLERSRTREGPLALRSEISFVRMASHSLLGSAVATEFTLSRAFRLDLGLGLLGGVSDDQRSRPRLLELETGPAVRARLSPRLDLDLGALLRASVVHVAGATSVDRIASQQDTWSARGGAVMRLQPSLSHWVRVSLGLEAGLVLRGYRAGFADGSEQHFEGGYAAVSLGVVLTPRAPHAAR